MVSDTATAFSPPNTAYNAPMMPTSTIRMVSAVWELIPKIWDRSNIWLKPMAPAYRHTGIPINRYPTRKNRDTIRRTKMP